MPEGKWAFLPIERFATARLDYTTLRAVIDAAVTPPRPPVHLQDAAGDDSGIAEPIAESFAEIEVQAHGQG